MNTTKGDCFAGCFIPCSNCLYQLENAEARCRCCEALPPSRRDGGNPNMPWYGVFQWEYDTFTMRQKVEHLVACKWRARTRFHTFKHTYEPTTSRQLETQQAPALGDAGIQSHSEALAFRPVSPAPPPAPVASALFERPQASSAAPGQEPKHEKRVTTPSTSLPASQSSSVERALHTASVVPQHTAVGDTSNKTMPQKASHQSSETESDSASSVEEAVVEIRAPVKSIPVRASSQPVRVLKESSGFPQLPPALKVAMPSQNPGKTAIIVKIVEPRDPSMPEEPCSFMNKDVFPYDHWEETDFNFGYTRPKKWSGARCSCGGDHPQQLHENPKWDLFYETFHSVVTTEQLNDETCCKACPSHSSMRFVHTTSQHGRFGFYDHPDNPQVDSDILRPFLKPWPEMGTKWEPLPRHFYARKKFSHPGENWPRLPFHIMDGVVGGLLDKSKKPEEGRKGAIHYAVTLTLHGSKPITRAGDRGPGKPHTPTGKAPARQDQKDKSKGKQPETVSPKVDESACTCTKKHPQELPCHRLDSTSLNWFNSEFAARMEYIMTDKDVNDIRELQKEFDNSVKLARKNHGAERLRALNVRDAALEIYELYVPLWTPEVARMVEGLWPSSLRKFRKERNQKPTLMRHIPTAAEIEEAAKEQKASTSSGVAGCSHRTISEALYKLDFSQLHHDVGFTPLPESDQYIRDNWSDLVEDEVDDGSSKAPSTGLPKLPTFHEQLFPFNEDLRKKHMESWMRFMEQQTTEDMASQWYEWARVPANEAICDLDFFLKNASHKEEWTKVMHQVVPSMNAEVIKTCAKFRSILGEDAIKELKPAKKAEDFKAFVNRVWQVLKDYENSMEDIICSLWDESHEGLGSVIGRAIEMDGAEHWDSLRGQVLPGPPAQPSCIPRFVWPRGFVARLQSKGTPK